MTPTDDRYIQLQIGLSSSTRSKWLVALRTTANYYGWTEEFPIWMPQDAHQVGGITVFRDPGRRGDLQSIGGKRLLVCRAASTAGWSAGKTNAFRVSSAVSNFDLAELAHFTKGDWHWMEGLHGQRIRRENWEAIWQAKTSKASGGLVSV